MFLYNTLTRKKEEFVPITKGKVKMYTCGPTTYNFIHIGNARPICVFDTLWRYLEYIGFDVTFVQNYTDIDDKIINTAKEQGVDASTFANRFIAEFETDARGLNAKVATHHPKVSESMPEIIAFIESLVEKGFAYPSNGDVYFRTDKFDEYGKLSHMPLDDLEAGARIEVNATKENPMDFALWKAAKAGEPSWQTPWGIGRPGWHIECSAMVKRYLGDTIDIHCGGQDLIFPHHENEIAQSECANGCEFAHYWLHNGYINIDNKKMSKSLNNFFTTRDVAQKYGYEAIRLLMIQSHYRSQINYTPEVIEACVASLERIYTCKEAIVMAIAAIKDGGFASEIDASFDGYRVKFKACMDDDLNTADALAVIFDMVRDINIALTDQARKAYLVAALAMLGELCSVLGLLLKTDEVVIPPEVMELVQKRVDARKNKNFALADTIRDEILALGYVIEETRQGTKISLA